jgi:hypothetical protein
MEERKMKEITQRIVVEQEVKIPKDVVDMMAE